MQARSFFVLLGTVLYTLVVVKDTIEFWKWAYQIRTFKHMLAF